MNGYFDHWAIWATLSSCNVFNYPTLAETYKVAATCWSSSSAQLTGVLELPSVLLALFCLV